MARWLTGNPIFLGLEETNVFDSAASLLCILIFYSFFFLKETCKTEASVLQYKVSRIRVKLVVSDTY